MEQREVNKETITRYLANQLSDKERADFEGAIKKDVQLKKEFILQKNLWSLSYSLEQFGKPLENTESNRFIFQLDQKREAEKSKLRVMRRLQFYKVAALIAISLMIGSIGMLILNYSEVDRSEEVFYTESYVPKGERSELTLPDGTHLLINADTRVKIPSDFSKTNRRLWIEGEGYFTVTSDSLHPFLLETPTINVEVLGTVFNIGCYPAEEEVEVVLEEGRVMFSGTNNTLVDGIVLKPGETAKYIKSSKELVVQQTGNITYVTGWKEGVFRFKNMTFGELVVKLERQYNVEIDVRDPELLDERFTGEVNSETVRSVMQNFALATPFNVSFKGRHITVTKRKNYK
ncbi:MAG: FecR domain-containing protein [Marinilabiliaceae bacterium]|nr:FecR domain-containing protein [Marinilabiliaceae bacterium]